METRLAKETGIFSLTRYPQWVGTLALPTRRAARGFFALSPWIALILMLALTIVLSERERTIAANQLDDTARLICAQLARRMVKIVDSRVSMLETLAGRSPEVHDPAVHGAAALISQIIPGCQRLIYLDHEATPAFAVSRGDSVPVPQIPTMIVGWAQTWKRLRKAFDAGHYRSADQMQSTADGNGYLLIVPISDQTSGHSEFAGAVVGQFPVEELIERSADPVTRTQFDARLTEAGHPLAAAAVHSAPGEVWSIEGEPLHLENASWTLQVRPRPILGQGDIVRNAPRKVLLGGIVASLFMFGVMLQVQRYRRRDIDQAAGYSAAIEKLHSVSFAISDRAGSDEDVLSQLGEAVGEILRMEKTCIMVVEKNVSQGAGAIHLPASVSVRVVANSGWSETAIGQRIKLEEGTSAYKTIVEKKEIVVGDTLQTNLSQYVFQNYNIRSMMQIPLLIEGKVIALLSLADPNPREFSLLEQRVARLWAAQAAVILSHIQLRSQAQGAMRAKEDLLQQRERLAAATAAIYAEPTLQGVISRIVKLAPAMMIVDLCVVALAKGGNIGDLLLICATPPLNELEGSTIEGPYRPVQRIFAQKRPRIVTNAGAEAELHPIWRRAGTVGSFINVPMFQADGQPLGTLTLIRRKVGEFADDQIELAQIFAARAGTAIETARLHQQTRSDAETKAMLLRELNHRVKNNLAGIAGLLAMEEGNVPENSRHTLARLAHRVSVMAGAHELFAGGVSTIGLSELVRKVLASVSMVQAPVEISLDLEKVRARFKTDQAVSLAMVLHELTFNAMTHGLGHEGVMQIRAYSSVDRTLVIDVIDDGSGKMPRRDTSTDPFTEASGGTLTQTKVARRSATSRTGMGLLLVDGLVCRELRGRFQLDDLPEGGTRARVEIPFPEEQPPEMM